MSFVWKIASATNFLISTINHQAASVFTFVVAIFFFCIFINRWLTHSSQDTSHLIMSLPVRRQYGMSQEYKMGMKTAWPRLPFNECSQNVAYKQHIQIEMAYIEMIQCIWDHHLTSLYHTAPQNRYFYIYRWSALYPLYKHQSLTIPKITFLKTANVQLFDVSFLKILCMAAKILHMVNKYS